jgi:K+/H+ antiporter YhaU regulatory subunit KhtT
VTNNKRFHTVRFNVEDPSVIEDVVNALRNEANRIGTPPTKSAALQVIVEQLAMQIGEDRDKRMKIISESNGSTTMVLPADWPEWEAAGWRRF